MIASLTNSRFIFIDEGDAMRRLLTAATMLGAMATTRTEAAFTYLIQQTGANVVVTGSGSLNVAGLQALNGTSTVGIDPTSAAISSGPAPVSANEFFYVFIAGPASFGTGGDLSASSGSGASMGFDGPGRSAMGVATGMGVPAGYISGTALASSITFNNQTFATLGLTPGTYTYTYSAAQGGPTLDSFIVQIGPAAVVPEPASALMFALGLAGAGLVGWKRSRRS